MSTLTQSQIDLQMRALDVALSDAVAQRRPVRPIFAQAWQAWYRKNWARPRGIMAMRCLWSDSDTAAWNGWLRKWIAWFMGEGIVFPITSAGGDAFWTPEKVVRVIATANARAKQLAELAQANLLPRNRFYTRVRALLSEWAVWDAAHGSGTDNATGEQALELGQRLQDLFTAVETEVGMGELDNLVYRSGR
jgi:hypothetical protein